MLVPLCHIFSALPTLLQRGQSQALFSGASDRTGGNGYKLKLRKFCLNFRKHFFIVRLTGH